MIPSLQNCFERFLPLPKKPILRITSLAHDQKVQTRGFECKITELKNFGISEKCKINSEDITGIKELARVQIPQAKTPNAINHFLEYLSPRKPKIGAEAK